MPDDLEILAVDFQKHDDVDKAPPRAPVSPACEIKNRSNAVRIFLGAKNLGLPQALNVKRPAGPPVSVLDPALNQVRLKGRSKFPLPIAQQRFDGRAGRAPRARSPHRASHGQ